MPEFSSKKPYPVSFASQITVAGEGWKKRQLYIYALVTEITQNYSCSPHPIRPQTVQSTNLRLAVGRRNEKKKFFSTFILPERCYIV